MCEVCDYRILIRDRSKVMLIPAETDYSWTLRSKWTAVIVHNDSFYLTHDVEFEINVM